MMENFEGLIRRLVRGFDAFGLDYMFTGALAVSYYGVPRTTMDVDIVVRIDSEDIEARLVPALREAGLQDNGRRIDAALRSGFQIVTFTDSRSPFSVDVILSRERLEKRAGTVLGHPTFYQTPEGLILAKLRMIKATVPRERALKDEDDVRGILRFTEVDIDEIRKRARADSTLSIFENIAPEYM